VRKPFFICLFCLAVPFCFSQTQVTLDAALQDGVSWLRGRLPRNVRLAVLNIQSDGPELSDQVLRRLGAALVNDGHFVVVERDAAALAALRRESDYQLSGEVSDATSLSIGRQLGAEVVLSGAMGRSGPGYRLDLKAVHVETARIEAQWSAERIRPDPAWADLDRSSRTASLSFAGDGLSEREQQYFADALGRGLEGQGVPLELDPDPVSERPDRREYTFTVTVHRTPIPPAPPANTALLGGEIAVTLREGSRVLRRGGPYRVTETTPLLLARRGAEELRRDREFFAGINKSLTQ
jgi:hypothetical protein